MSAPDVPGLLVSEIPRSRSARLLWLAALEMAIARDAQQTRAAMRFEGWADEEARSAYRDWLQRVVDGAVAEGWPS